MIAKFKNRVDFAGLVSYANDIKSEEKRGRLLSFQGVCVVSNEQSPTVSTLISVIPTVEAEYIISGNR